MELDMCQARVILRSPWLQCVVPSRKEWNSQAYYQKCNTVCTTQRLSTSKQIDPKAWVALNKGCDTSLQSEQVLPVIFSQVAQLARAGGAGNVLTPNLSDTANTSKVYTQVRVLS